MRVIIFEEEVLMSRKKTRGSRCLDSKNKTVAYPTDTIPLVFDIMHHDQGGLSVTAYPIDQTEQLADQDAHAHALRLDRDWFRAHPNRSHRIRRAIRHEFPLVTADEYIVVRQHCPGCRERRTFSTTAPLPGGDAPEQIAHAIFDLVEEYNGRAVPDHEVFRRIHAYSIAHGPTDSTDEANETVH